MTRHDCKEELKMEDTDYAERRFNMPDIVLTSRQWRLYDFIKARCESHIKRTNYDAILADIELNSDYAKDNYSDQCRAIRKDIETINFSGVIQKSILSDKDGYYIAKNDLEFRQCMEKRYKSLRKRYAELAILCKKHGLNENYFLDTEHHIRDHVEATIHLKEMLQNVDK